VCHWLLLELLPNACVSTLLSKSGIEHQAQVFTFAFVSFLPMIGNVDAIHKVEGGLDKNVINSGRILVVRASVIASERPDI
jgi:hypothetical protein